ncbi:MAG: helix-turn-helix transcriptional regulator [Clostridia bacterium]|nr:helix-turn-helix transcriptional regulator [Clostridia bacterium]
MIQNNIGEKIRRLRLHRKMTQSELAGDQITRNMLSCIENGAALPSLPTVWYLAERLEVPAGFLLAEGDDDRIWRKMNEITDIKRVFGRGDPRICLALCRGCAEEADDEIFMIMAQCSLMIAEEELNAGHLKLCCAALDEAVATCERSVYNTQMIKHTAALYFRFLRGLSQSLYPESQLDVDDCFLGAAQPFCRYILAREALDQGDRRRVEIYLQNEQEDDPWWLLLRAHKDTADGNFETAHRTLTKLLHDENVSSRPLVYYVFCDLEICCRETGDFRGAYEYSQDKVHLLESMLE